MNRKMKILFMGCLVVALVALAMLGPVTKPALGQEKYEIENWASTFGTGAWRLTFYMTDILNRRLPEFHVKGWEGTGSPANIMNTAKYPLERRKRVMWNVNEQSFFSAKNGWKPFDKAYPDVRLLFNIKKAGVSFCTLDPNIKTKEDMIGKTIATAPKLSGQAGTTDWIIDNAFGIRDKVKVKYMGLRDAAEALMDGTVDVCFMDLFRISATEWLPSEFLAPVIATKKVYPIGYQKGEIQAGLKKQWMPYGVQTIMPGSIPGLVHTQPMEMLTFGTGSWGCFACAEEEVIYKIVKTLINHADDFSKYDPVTGKSITKEQMAVMAYQEDSNVHPGALRAYKEAGLWK